MKIALVIDRFLPKKGGGERYVQVLARNLVRRGHQVTIFARRFPEPPFPDGNIRYQPVHVPSWPGFLRVLLFAQSCEKGLKKGDFDIVHDVGHMVGADIFNPHGGVEQVWLKRYFASYRHPVHRSLKMTQRLLSPKEWAVLYLQKRQYLSPETRRILAIAPMIREHIRSRYPEIPERKITLINNPAELSRFTPKNRERFRQKERERLRLKNGEVALLFAGNNFRLKGLHPLLRSLAALEGLDKNRRPFRLFVAGNEKTSRWQKWAIKWGVERRITFLGPVTEMERLYAAADIFVLPTFYDSASLVVLEALASGLPVITSRWNGASFLIDAPEVGVILKNNDDPREIAQAIHRFFPEKTREQALTAAPQRVSTLGVEFHVDKILEIYGEVLREKNG